MDVGTLVEIVVNMNWMSRQTLNVWQYMIGSIPGSVTMVQLLEAYWNHVRVTYRGLYSASYGAVFVSLKGREMNDAFGQYAEFDIPIADRAGTRGTAGEALPAQNAATARLVVGTRATRPGSKRFAGLLESDNASGVLQTSYFNPLVALLNVMTVQMILGAPAATTELNPIITKKDNNGIVINSQAVTGYLINSEISSQNSRKTGRGA